jgi:nitrate reductase molybdenum cofactor assembly chaperone NarJ/NarW
MSRLLTRRRATAASGVDLEQLRVAWQSASLLLGYPDDELLGQLPLVEEASHLLPAALGQRVRDLVGHLSSTPLEQLQAEYVETFDTRRRTNLFLTYFAHGDTRKRGMALLRFKQAYLRAGHQLPVTGDGAELPDHLCVVLEFGATVDPDAGWRLLTDHRAGLELLRLALRDSGSPWGAAVDVVSATLPRLRGDEMDAVRRLAAEGPPEEEVGLSGYGDVGLVPGAAPGGPPIGLPARPPPAPGGSPEPLPFPSMPSSPGGPL